MRTVRIQIIFVHDFIDIDSLLIENQTFATNLTRYFPGSNKNYEEFTDMVLFFRKSDIGMSKNEFININRSFKTTLLERFFMVVKGVVRPE
jgi:hypothetical protein